MRIVGGSQAQHAPAPPRRGRAPSSSAPPPGGAGRGRAAVSPRPPASAWRSRCQQCLGVGCGKSKRRVRPAELRELIAPHPMPGPGYRRRQSARSPAASAAARSCRHRAHRDALPGRQQGEFRRAAPHRDALPAPSRRCRPAAVARCPDPAQADNRPGAAAGSNETVVGDRRLDRPQRRLARRGRESPYVRAHASSSQPSLASERHRITVAVWQGLHAAAPNTGSSRSGAMSMVQRLSNTISSSVAAAEHRDAELRRLPIRRAPGSVPVEDSAWQPADWRPASVAGSRCQVRLGGEAA